ncbi:MAG: hypothetical protein CM15mV69_010 [Caudoviricetes sp.]|nr:MAG: hypothetical protein CM15mV69_010 [Caudoviricetes sp.]
MGLHETVYRQDTIHKFNETELRVDLPNGSRITLLGSENSDSLRGIYLDGCVIDEYANVNDKLFPEIIDQHYQTGRGTAYS